MYKRTTVIRNKSGLHMRPASEFVARAGRSASEVTIGRVASSEAINAKSIVLLLHLALAQGTEVEISAQGVDEVHTVDGLIELIDAGFGEL